MEVFTKSFWDKNPSTFRALLLMIGIVFSIISLWNFYTNFSMPTDENVFRDPISKYYIIKPIASSLVNNEGRTTDTIHIGDMLLKINDVKIDSARQITEKIFFLKHDEEVKLQIACTHKKEIRDHIVRKSDIPANFYRILNSAVLVTNISSGGASDRAGIKVGDIITKINGKTFRSAVEADLIMRSLKADTDFKYQVLRNNTEFDIRIRLAKYGISFAMFFYFVSGFLFIGLGLFLGLTRPKFIAARLSGLALLFVGFSINGSFNTASNAFVSSSAGFKLLLLLTNAVMLFGISLFIHSLYYFPIERTELIKRKWAKRTPYILAFVSLSLVSFFLVATELNNRLVSTLLSTAIVLSYVVFVIIISVKFRLRNSQKSRIGRAVMWALNLNLLLMAIQPLSLLLRFEIPLVANASLAIILIPIAYLYTIARYGLLDMDFRMRKNNQYILTIVFLKVVLIFVYFIFIWFVSHSIYELPNIHFTGSTIEVLSKPLSWQNIHFYSNFINISFAIAFGYLLLGFSRVGVKLVDKKFFRSDFDYKKIMTELSEMVENNISVENLLNSIVNQLKDSIHVNKMAIILYNDNGTINHFVANETIDIKLKYELTTIEKDFFIALAQISGTLRTEYIVENVKSVLTSEGIKMIMPLISKGKIIGALFLGDKLSETPINNEDISFVQSFTTQAIVALENVLLYESLSAQERMKHELELARKIQSSSLPKFMPQIKGLDISAISIPAFEVGGDYYDFLNVSDSEVTIVVGDVSGKGASAALYMSKTQGIMRTLAEFNLMPKDLLIRTNNLLHKYIEKNSFISVVACKFDIFNKNGRITRAGHLPMLVLRNGEKQVDEIKPKGIVLGVSAETFFAGNLEEVEFRFSSGDIFLFATDGAIEARNGNDEFGIERLKALLIHYRHLSSAALNGIILNEINRYSDGNTAGDDLTLLVVKVV